MASMTISERIRGRRAVASFTARTRRTGSATQGLQAFNEKMKEGKKTKNKKPTSSPGLLSRAKKAIGTRQEKRNPQKKF